MSKVDKKFIENQLWIITNAALDALKEMDSREVSTSVSVSDDKELRVSFGIFNKEDKPNG